MFDPKMLDEILRATISEIEKSKEQIFDIAESARRECDRVEQELQKIKKETLKIIEQVDYWEMQERKARNYLAHVSGNFSQYSEEDIRKAYEKAFEIQSKVVILRKEEEQYKEKRTELERSYKNMRETVEKAERLVAQVGVALTYLSNNLDNIWNQLDKLQRRQDWGLAVIRAQEEERRRIARGLHDGPAQQLANIVLRTEFCQKLFKAKPQDLEDELKELKEFARNTLEDIRKILFDLRPMDLDDLGLVAAVKRFLSKFEESTGIATEFKASGNEQRYTPGLEVALFRVVQEALNNVRKHSKARNVSVILELAPLSLNAIVKDDGCGFDTEAELSDQQFGLKGMHEWADLLGGELKITSRVGKGTRVAVSIPIDRE
ncbi:MAG: two-component system, NarL family, sensor histidine kinase DegS [Clostridia bacterium]|jgi:two-component system sensor histidine kinase DegS|nr:Sensor DegS domain protein [Clostridiales bacterium]MDK2985678.1 two-component system, NarL family, sensor histidine kinase DegS [Clostridia bacterium]